MSWMRIDFSRKNVLQHDHWALDIHHLILQSRNTRKKWNDSCASESNENIKTDGADLSAAENGIKKVKARKKANGVQRAKSLSELNLFHNISIIFFFALV